MNKKEAKKLNKSRLAGLKIYNIEKHSWLQCKHGKHYFIIDFIYSEEGVFYQLLLVEYLAAKPFYIYPEQLTEWIDKGYFIRPINSYARFNNQPITNNQ